jgi:hypothetical protein
MRRILAIVGCAGLLGLMHPATPGWAVTGNEWTALAEDQQAMYLIGVLDQWKWAVGLFDAERAQRGGQASPAEAWLKWVHQCLASCQMTYRQIGAMVSRRLGAFPARRLRGHDADEGVRRRGRRGRPDRRR